MFLRQLSHVQRDAQAFLGLENSDCCLNSMRDRAPHRPARSHTVCQGVCSLPCGATVRPDVQVGHCPRAGHSGSTMATCGAWNQNSHSMVSVPTEELSFPRSAAGPRCCPTWVTQVSQEVPSQHS